MSSITPEQHPTSEAGFGLIELLIAMVILQIALLALVGAFGAGSVALGRASKANTAQALANQQMELYRSMTYDPIGLDTAAAPATGMYVADTSVCTAGLSPVCGNTGPVNNPGSAVSSQWSCTIASGTWSVAFYYSANGINPCLAHRPVSGASSPDGLSYFVDTYIKLTTGSTTQRPVKQIWVVVRDGVTGKALVKETSTIDCGTANPPGSAPCH
jgi:type II secretory pathway pseudopilin PulG